MTDKPTRRSHAELAPSAAKVLGALHRLGEATAAATAAEAGLGYSTTTPKLRALENAGLAEPFRAEDGRVLWRLTDTGRATAEAADTPPDPGPQPPPAGPVEADVVVTVTPADVADGSPAQPDLDPGSPGVDAQAGTADVMAAVEQPADDSPHVKRAAPAGDGDQPEPQLRQIPTSRPDGVPRDGVDDPPGTATATAGSGADQPTGTPPPAVIPDPAGPASPPPAARATDSAVQATPAGTGADRRVAGTLRGVILDILEAHPDEQYKVSELCKLVDSAHEGSGVKKASAGAVHNAVTKLVEQGSAVLAVEKPATFALARPSN